METAGFDGPITASYLKLNGKFQLIAVGTVITLFLLALGMKFPALVERINNAVIDNQIGLLSKTNLSSIPVIVEVDEASLAKYGQWPWPRYRVANLLAAIQKTGALAVGVDAVFVEPDRTSPLEVQRSMANDLQQALDLSSIDESLWDYDKIFGETLKTGSFVVSYFFNSGGLKSQPCSPKSASGAFLSAQGESSSYLIHLPNITCNVPPIQDGANSGGFINASPDSDGIYRKTPLVMNYQGRLYPSLALQTFLTAKRLDSFLVKSDETGLSLQVGEMSIPVDKAGNLLIKLPLAGQHFRKISAVDLMQGKVGGNALKNNIVFVGFSAAGLHEYRPTPYAPQFLGVEFHAAIIDNLVREDFLHRPDHAQEIELIVAALLTIFLFFGLAESGLVVSVATPCMLVFALLAASQLLLVKMGTVLSPALPVLMVLVSFLVLTVMKYVGEYLHAKAMAVQVARTQEGIIGSFCSMSEYRDPETGAHIKRTQEYIKALAVHLQNHPKFKGQLTVDFIGLLFKAAPLHDIGKIGIRDHILLKNDRLTDIEFAIMQSHPQIGADIIASVASQIGWNPFMRIAHEICLCHQEKWDGSGYPQSLAGEAIPLSARFMALADVYDALISKRVYKPAFSHQMAVALIREGKNTHFDPIIVEAFEAIHLQFRSIALNFLDSEDQRETLLAEKK